MGGAELNRDLVIRAHPHAQAPEAVTLGYFRQQGKMQRRFLAKRRQAHETSDSEAIITDASRDQGVRVGGGAAGLLGFLAGVDLNETIDAAAGPVHFPGDGRGELFAIDGFDDIEKPDRLPGLVGLQRSDQVEHDIVMGFAQGRPFEPGFLDPVFPEHPVPGRERGANAAGLVLFADRDQGDGRRIPSRGPGSGGDGFLDRRQIRGYGPVGGLVCFRHTILDFDVRTGSGTAPPRT